MNLTMMSCAMIVAQSDEVPKIRSDHHQDTVATKMFDIPLCSVCLEDR